jgi:predicted lipoprotein
MKVIRLAMSLVTLAAAAGAGAQSPAAGGPVEVQASGTPGKATAERTVRKTGTVYAVDVPSRILTLQYDMGGTETMKVGPAVKDLDRFAAGDTVVAELHQGLALEFQPAGADFVPPTATSSPTAAGADAVATAGQTVRATVTVTALDAKRRLVTLQTPGGKIYRVKAGPKVQLDKVKVGDSLLATYVEAVAIRLEKARPGSK